jgi:hypothetical protein
VDVNVDNGEVVSDTSNGSAGVDLASIGYTNRSDLYPLSEQ